MVDQLGGDSVTIHIREAQPRVVETVPARAMRFLHLGQVRRLLLRAEEEDGGGIDLVVLLERRKEFVIARLEVLGPELLRNSGVRVRRDEDQLVHLRSFT